MLSNNVLCYTQLHSMLLFLVLSVNSDQFQILRSYKLLLYALLTEATSEL